MTVSQSGADVFAPTSVAIEYKFVEQKPVITLEQLNALGVSGWTLCGRESLMRGEWIIGVSDPTELSFTRYIFYRRPAEVDAALAEQRGLS